MAILVIHERDNVAVTISDIKKGEKVAYGSSELTALENIDKGHKIALRDIEAGENVIKYGFAIGKTNTAVKAGQWLHTHNVKTNLGEVLDYQYSPDPVYHAVSGQCGKTFRGYRRDDGTVGIRNEVWIIPTVSCVNRAAQLIAKTAQADLRCRMLTAFTSSPILTAALSWAMIIGQPAKFLLIWLIILMRVQY